MRHLDKTLCGVPLGGGLPPGQFPPSACSTPTFSPSMLYFAPAFANSAVQPLPPGSPHRPPAWALWQEICLLSPPCYPEARPKASTRSVSTSPFSKQQTLAHAGFPPLGPGHIRAMGGVTPARLREHWEAGRRGAKVRVRPCPIGVKED